MAVGADLAVVTGDLITGVHDSVWDCVEEVRHVRAPLGVYGCNGNHEIYARAEDLAARNVHRNKQRILVARKLALPARKHIRMHSNCIKLLQLPCRTRPLQRERLACRPNQYRIHWIERALGRLVKGSNRVDLLAEEL